MLECGSVSIVMGLRLLGGPSVRRSSAILFSLETEPTSVQSWSKHYALLLFPNKWHDSFKNILKMSADNKLRQFPFKLLHRILANRKELMMN